MRLSRTRFFITFRITRESAEFTLKLVIQYFHYHIPLPKFYSFPHTKLILEIPLTSTVSPVCPINNNTNEKTREICQNMKNGARICNYCVSAFLSLVNTSRYHIFPRITPIITFPHILASNRINEPAMQMGFAHPRKLNNNTLYIKGFFNQTTATK